MLKLDDYYFATRYPDALPDDVMVNGWLSHSEAEEALATARLVLSRVDSLLNV